MPNKGIRYDEDFKKTIIALHQNGRTQASLIKEYDISQSAISKWIKQYSSLELGNGEIFTAKQIKQLQQKNAKLEEEHLILKKAIAIFTPHSIRD
ncbi:transposase [Criibacterium bergeronii]|uniref:Transposase n=1 Tax=Criibacterium bergeronii TaxID=1871336 RepID=A0A552UQU7_9FIRM|nr:transposase [Criibacterium bergeronii]TRW20599.1 transposase [Criibacterium bergeronii]